MEFNYTTKVMQKKYGVNYLVKEKINSVFKNIITDLSTSKYDSFHNYLLKFNIKVESHFGNILTNIISYYLDVKNFKLDKEWKDKISLILKNEYIKLEMSQIAKLSYLPSFEEYTLYWNDKKYEIKNPDEIEKIFMSNVELKSFDMINEAEDETTLKIEVDFVNKKCFLDNKIQSNKIFMEVLQENMPSFEIVGAINTETLENDFQLVSSRFYRKNINENNTDIGGGFVSLNIMDNALEYIQIFKMHGFYFYRKKIVSENKLRDSIIYKQIILDINSISTNKYDSWIVRECVKNQNLTPEALNNLLLVNKSITKDKETCRIILLSDSLEPNSIEMDKYDFENAVEKYSAQRLDYAFTRLKEPVRDTINNIKLLTRLYSNGYETSLSESQRNIIKNIELKRKAIDSEHTELIGQIVKSGIREKMKNMTSDTKDEFGFNNSFRKWLNNNQGHNKGVEINEDQLNKTRSIWNKIYKWKKVNNDI